MIRHHRIGIHRHGKAFGQFQYPRLDPLAAIFKALSSQPVLATQKSTSHTSCHDMVVTGVVFGNQMTAWISHAGILASGQLLVYRRSPQWAVGNLLFNACPEKKRPEKKRKRAEKTRTVLPTL